MFVVSMMITVLAAVGMFALAAAATEVKTAGNERQSAQTHYIAELALSGAQRETGSGRLGVFQSLMRNAGSSNTCASLPIPSSAAGASSLVKACAAMDGSSLGTLAGWSAATTNYTLAPYTTGSTPGSLGPVPVNPNFRLEVSEITSYGTGFGNSGTGNMCLVTVTGIGQTVPTFNGATSYSSEGIEMERARFVVPPGQLGQCQ
jgi:type II secretory pathway pseudopilin PulG